MWNKNNLRVAAVQMEASPAPTHDRLARAERLVNSAVENGAQLVVLPEVFNTGYGYSDENYARVETIDGLTATWMGKLAAKCNILLAGSMMLLERDEVYNALLLFAPDGRMWRYDKNYPWGWERGYFRGSQREPKITIADTDLGNIGMLICWDVAHLNLWEQYAGRVDLMIICCCPPDVGDAIYQFPDGNQLTFDDMGSRVAATKDNARVIFGDMINQQTAWLGVPAVSTVGCGQIQTDIPKGRHTLLGYALAAPWLLKHFRQADRLRMSCDMVHECKILDGSGAVLARLNKEDGEAFALADVNLAGLKKTPQEPQPAAPIPGLAYFISDVFLPTITKSVYRKGQRLWKNE